MLPQAQLIDAIAHDDYFVRSRLLHRFMMDRETDPAIGRQYRRAIEEFGWEEAFDWVHCSAGVPYDEETTEWLLDSICDTSNEGPNASQQFYLLRAFSKGPIESIERYVGRFDADWPEGSEEIREHVVFRLALENMGIDQRQAEMTRLLEECAAGHEESEFPAAQISLLEEVSKRLVKLGGLEPSLVEDRLMSDFCHGSELEFWQGDGRPSRVKALLQNRNKLRLVLSKRGRS
ncbi:MAG: hypothetical protein AAF514_02740 [Verrucomicrobiota bacterium]